MLVSRKEMLMNYMRSMRPMPIAGSASSFVMAIAAGCLILAPARAHAIGLFSVCGAGLDLCVQDCDYGVPGGLMLGRCYDHCSRGAGVCEASRIPRPVGYRSRIRSPAIRK